MALLVYGKMVYHLEHFEITYNTTHDQYVYASTLDRVPYFRLLPPAYPRPTLSFRFAAMDTRFHNHCCGSASWEGMVRRTFRTIDGAVRDVALFKKTYWCHHCDKGLFFPVSCTLFAPLLSTNINTLPKPPFSAHVKPLPQCLQITLVLHYNIRLFPEPRGMAQYKQSVGQGNAFSRCQRALLRGNSSIIRRLQARHLTRQGLHLDIHQHYGYNLHLVWISNRRHIRLHRRFHTLMDVRAFCEDLRTLSPLGTCLAVRWYDAFLLHKAVPCYNIFYSNSEWNTMSSVFHNYDVELNTTNRGLVRGLPFFHL
jgi:hypothetical protein